MATYLFDLDGTLLLTGGAGSRALNRAFLREYGVSEAMANVSPAGMTDPLIVREGLRIHFGRDPRPGEVARILAIYLSYLPEEVSRSERFRLMPGVPQVLDRLLAAGHAIGLATGNIREGARVKLEHAGIWQRFSFGGFGDDAEDRTELVRIAAKRAPQPQDTWIVGDTPRDIAAAIGAGFQSVAVATGPHDIEELRATGATITIETLEHLP